MNIMLGYFNMRNKKRHVFPAIWLGAGWYLEEITNGWCDISYFG